MSIQESTIPEAEFISTPALTDEKPGQKDTAAKAEQGQMDSTIGKNCLELSVADMADILHQASMLYLSSNMPNDYGTGEKYTAVEVHMLKYIIDHPGLTVTNLACDWDKTKAAISLMTKKLEEKGLIYRGPAPDSFKKQLYYATEKGIALNDAHLQYDTRVFGQTIDLLKGVCSDEDIELCFQVLKKYCEFRRRKHYRSPVLADE